MDASEPLVAAAASATTAAPTMFDTVYPLTVLILLGAAIPAGLLLANVALSKWAHGTGFGNQGLTGGERGEPDIVEVADGEIRFLDATRRAADGAKAEAFVLLARRAELHDTDGHGSY